MRNITIRAILLATALATISGAPAATASAKGHLKTQIKVEKFIVGKDGIRALGQATSRLGEFHKTRRVLMKVKTGGSCSVLDVSIKELHLTLLGLDVNASAINLRITGNPKQSLGRLFCKLSRSLKLKTLNKRSARRLVRSLNSSFKRRSVPAVGFNGTVTRQQTTSEYAPCEVLNLVLGPVHVNLIGLVVDLFGATKQDPITAVVTADPTKGVLGAKFCELAGQK
jgi:hypothetical protein